MPPMGGDNVPLERLVQTIDEAIRAEQSVVPQYLEHIALATPESGWTEPARQHILNVLGRLNRESAEHERVLEDLRNAVMEHRRLVKILRGSGLRLGE